MIIVKAAGGLGNQMQQYALYRKLVLTGKKAKMDVTWFTEEDAQNRVLQKRCLELASFGKVSLETCTQKERDAFTGGAGFTGKLRQKLGAVLRRTSVFRETDMFHPEILEMEEGYLDGYFACDRYYADIFPQLREEFVFPESGDAVRREQNAAIMRQMKADAFPVSIHLRRGDYLDSANAALFGGICTDAYYEGAVRELRLAAAAGQETALRFHFYIFSDDPEYARQLHFGTEEEENTVVDWNSGKDSMLDIQLMSCCKGNICANSTFSFWGARLNGHENKLMIRPSVHKNTQHPTAEQMHELWKGWILVDREGRLF